MTERILLNRGTPGVVPTSGFAPESRAPMAVHRGLPDYAPTPLRSHRLLAERLGVGQVWVKDESSRLGLPSFKILGASWATFTAIHHRWPDSGATSETVDGLRADLAGRPPLTLVAATDGNHGRGVARMAALLGTGCHILVPAGTAAARVDALAAEGARVDVVEGSYDDAVAASAQLAAENTLIVSDTSWPGYERIPRAVVEGYSTMFFEIDEQLAAAGAAPPTVVALQAGVGAFAAAGLRHYRSGPGPSTVSTIVVEPSSANCLMTSAAAGRPTLVPGPHPSRMAGLNCGLPSALVWPIIAAGTDTFVAIDDDTAEEAMRLYAAVGVVAGESGAASLAGLLAVSAHPDVAAATGLGPDSRVLLVNTEGATDPVNYRAVVETAVMSR